MSTSNIEVNDSAPPSPKAATRGKTDPAWGHCTEEMVVVKNKNVKVITCLHCKKSFQGGGIHRFKKHLAGVKGDVTSCKKVSADVRFQMKQSIDEFARKRRRLNEIEDIHSDEDQSPVDLSNEDEIVGNLSAPSSSRSKRVAFKGSQLNAGKRRSEAVKSSTKFGSPNYFMPRTTPGAQPSIKSVLQTKEAKENAGLAVSQWMIDAGVPFNASNSKYYQPMLDAIAGFGAGYRGPNVYELRGYLLQKNIEEAKKFVEGFRSVWKESGCTIMADGWTDQRRRTLINFLVQCPKGTVFLKSIDATDTSKTADTLFYLFHEVVEFVGSENVVHIVTDNARNYVAAGKLLEREFPTLYWSPCAAHCINLMLSDMGKLSVVETLVDKASSMTKYICNHCYPLHLMRKFTQGREILRPAPTRFATNFIALQSIFAQKDALRAMVLSREWTSSAYAKLTNEMRLFRNAEGDFGRATAVHNRSTMPPDEWWITYGSSTPNLQKLAVRILGQTCSSSGCERNWSVFEFIHSKKRNRMEHQRLNDLVYVRYNLRLHQRISFCGRNYDPISFEEFVDNEKWVLEEDPPFLTVDELEEFRKQMAGLNIQTNEDDDEFVNLDDSDDESEHPCTNNTQRDQEEEDQGVVAEDAGEESGRISVTQWQFTHL